VRRRLLEPGGEVDGVADPIHPLEVAGQQRPQRLRVGRLPERRRAGDTQKRAVTVSRCSRAGGAASSKAPQSHTEGSLPASLPTIPANRH
jgi:hypothetical protein